MAPKRHRLAVFIGRFQPFHIGHRAVIEEMVGQVDSLLVLIGSAYRPRSWKNPFSYDERRQFLEAGIDGIPLPVATLPLVDTLYNDRAWATNVRTAVRLYMRAKGLERRRTDIVLTGFEKDKSSQYLRWFPEWEMLPASAHRHNGKVISATEMREGLFFADQADSGQTLKRFGEEHVAIVRGWMQANPEAVAQLRAEAGYIKSYRSRVEAAEQVFGYPITINTVDAVVVQSGHVLMVQRKALPGRGLWALPGGHIAAGETALSAAIRELFEEAGLTLTADTLRDHLTSRRVFDHPQRSEKGWVRTEAFVFELQNRATLETVEAGSDAALARWLPITEITPDSIFEDHFDIIQALVPDVPFAYSSILMAHAT